MNQERISIMRKLLNLYKKLLELLRQIKSDDSSQNSDKSQAIYEYAKSCIGKKLSPIFGVYGCVEAVDNIVKAVTGKGFGEESSTYRLYPILRDNPRYKKISEPKLGDLIISPTGFGGNGTIPNGHLGIVSDNQKIMSNNSTTLLFEEHYTIRSWEDRYKKIGGYPIYYFRVLT